MQYAIGTKSVSESNQFLRCLWAEFRKNFGGCAWNYIPYKDGKSNAIHFGYADIGIGEPINVTIKYKERGAISNLILESEHILLSDVQERISKSVTTAKKKYFYPSLFNNSTVIKVSSPWNGFSDYVMSKYEGKHFRLIPGHGGKIEIHLSIMAFDEIDAATISIKLCHEVLHILTVCTNLIFDFTDRAGFTAITSAEQIFNNDAEWMDGFSKIDDIVAITSLQKELIDKYIGGELMNCDTISLAASHFYHSLRLQLMSPHNMFEELVSVLCISALEVASIFYGQDGKVCDNCGNMIYGIRKRVNSLVTKHGNERLVKFIDSYYAARSGFLHTGRLLSDRSYHTVTIPMLDNYSATGCVSQIPRPPINLIEYTSYLLRKTFADMI